jgi:hypothetical protein
MKVQDFTMPCSYQAVACFRFDQKYFTCFNF